MSTISHADFLAMQARLNRTLPLRQPAPVSRGVELEADLHAAISDECRARGWLALHGSMAHRAHRTPGEPDFVILAGGGRLMLVEAKARREKPTIEQNALHAHARKLGHRVWMVRTLGEFHDAIREMEAESAERPMKPA